VSSFFQNVVYVFPKYEFILTLNLDYQNVKRRKSFMSENTNVIRLRVSDVTDHRVIHPISERLKYFLLWKSLYFTSEVIDNFSQRQISIGKIIVRFVFFYTFENLIPMSVENVSSKFFILTGSCQEKDFL